MNCYVTLSKVMNPDEQRQAINRIRSSLEGIRPRILLIEDQDDDAFITLRIFKYIGLDAQWVRDVGSAIDKLKVEDFRIIFLDLKLNSTKDWVDFLTFYKSAGLSGQVIILTGAYAADDKECKDALKMGAAAVMLKPLTVEKAGLIFSTP